MSQINEILERVAEIQLTISIPAGPPITVVKKTFPYMPSDVSTAEAPFFVNELHGGPTDFTAVRGLQRVDDDIVMYLCLQRREQNTNLSLGTKETIAWRDAIFAAFAQKIRLSNPAGIVDKSFVLEARLKDWDFVSYEYGTATWLALRHTLTVRELFPETIHA